MFLLADKGTIAGINVNIFRHFYNYHFAENRNTWENYVIALSDEQFMRNVETHWSVKEHIVYIMSVDNTWFCGLRGLPIREPLNPADFPNLESIRIHWDNVERNMRHYLAELRNDFLNDKPLEGEDKDLCIWQVLLHVVNHDTDHRAQLLRVLNDLGVETVAQDYIFYVYDNI
jgi:uncharacterized damage-inducible protein DinB